jgi:hypothetical protein
MMEVVRTSETSDNFNVTTQRYTPEESKLHTHHRESLKSHEIIDVYTENHKEPINTKCSISDCQS